MPGLRRACRKANEREPGAAPGYGRLWQVVDHRQEGAQPVLRQRRKVQPLGQERGRPSGQGRRGEAEVVRGEVLPAAKDEALRRPSRPGLADQAREGGECLASHFEARLCITLVALIPADAGQDGVVGLEQAEAEGRAAQATRATKGPSERKREQS